MLSGSRNYIGKLDVQDLILIKLNNATRAYLDPSENMPRLGWSLLDPSNSNTKTAGHPNGNPMKVAGNDGITKIYQPPLSGVTIDGGWELDIAEGFVEIGQSGSPIINSEGYLIGVVSGIDSIFTCSGTNPSGKIYGSRLSYYYRSFSEWLDSAHTGAVQIPTWLPGGTEIGSYKYPSLSASSGTICANQTGYVTINNFCEFMEGYTTWSVSDPYQVNTQVLENGKKLEIQPASSGASGRITVTAQIDFGGWTKNYTTSIQIGKINSGQVTISGPSMACPYDSMCT